MYPDLERYNDCDAEYRGNSFFEQNCNQIFTKGPALTKDFLGKVNAEIVPKKTYIFGREFKTKRILLTTGLSLLFSTSLFVAIVTWFTSTFDNFVLSQMVLKNNSDAFRMWQKPSAKAIYNIYIFNYTNIDDYTNGYVDKLNLNELGPYAYEETLERIDISFPTDDTISFREKRSYNFMPRLSKGRESDLLVVPNLAVIGGSAATKTQGYFTRLAYNGILSALGEDAFLKITAGPLITGYKDKLYELAKTFLPEGTPDKMGLMASKIGESSSIFTINTGERDMNNYAMVQEVDGKSELDYFSGNTCNSVKGTDGALQPPKLVQSKQPLYYFFPQACRRMPLIFEKETTVLNGKVPAYQYVHPEDIFDSVEEKPENGCYCNMENGQCPLKGVFNVTMCNYDAPMFISHPHFHRADPRLLEPFTGLRPNGGDYKTYFKIHPTMGFTMSAKNSLQVNVQMQKAANVAKLDAFEDGMIFPVAILEGVLDDNTLPQDIINTINLVTFTAPTIKLAIQYGSLLTSIITLVSLVLVLRRKSSNMQRSHTDRLIRTNEGYYVAS